eukprot:COSAG01_NODE_3106_length_6575_cov_25.785207_6_plen_63_part_00
MVAAALLVKVLLLLLLLLLWEVDCRGREADSVAVGVHHRTHHLLRPAASPIRGAIHVAVLGV